MVFWNSNKTKQAALSSKNLSNDSSFKGDAIITTLDLLTDSAYKSDVR